MIPRRALFYWHKDSPPMSLLRRYSIETFKKHNPDWDVVVFGEPADLPPRGFCFAHHADIRRYERLRDEGGLVLETDTVFVKPIPDEWLDCDFCFDGCMNSLACFGSSAGNPLMDYCAKRAYELANMRGEPDYQVFGVPFFRLCVQELILASRERNTSSETGMRGQIETAMKIPDRAVWIPYESFIQVPPENPRDLWKPEGIADFPWDDVVGVHWFGGNIYSVSVENEEPNPESVLGMALAS